MLSQADKSILGRAMKAAEASKCNQRHGAVIKVGGRIIGIGINVDKNHPNNVNDPATQAAVHAEIAALKACGNTSVAGGTIYVARINKKGSPLMSKPCQRCQEAIKNAGIKKIVYTIDMMMEV